MLDTTLKKGKRIGKKARWKEKQKGKKKFRRQQGLPGGHPFRNVKCVQKWSEKAVTAVKYGLTLTFT